MLQTTFIYIFDSQIVFVCRPYDAATYEDEVDDDDVMDEEGRTRLKLKVNNSSLCRCFQLASLCSRQM